MSRFTVGLAILGGLVLATLVAWNTWITRKATPRQPEGGPRPLNERQDPNFNPSIVPNLAVIEKRPGLDALIDVMTPIALETPVSGEAALAAMPPTRRAGSKPFAIEGLNDVAQQWET